MDARKNNPDTPTADREFVISRRFDVPREFMFKLWTDPAHMQRWWGPKGVTVIHSKMDLRPGGIYHYCMRTPDGHEMWGKFVFREIVKPERLVFVNSFSDEKVRWAPLNATEEERKTFEAGFDSMQKGWGGTFEQLGEYLAKAGGARGES